MFFLFRKKERTKEKSILSFSRLVTIYSFFGGYGFLYTRGGARLPLYVTYLRRASGICFVAGFCLSRDSLSGAIRDTANRGYLFKAGYTRGGFTATQAGRLRGKSGRCPRLTINRSRAREDALRPRYWIGYGLLARHQPYIGVDGGKIPYGLATGGMS